MSGFLLDTNIISELIKASPAPSVVSWLDQSDEDLLHLSVFTLGEIRKGIASLTNSKRRVRLESWLEADLRQRFSGRILPITERIANRWGSLAGHAKRQTQLPVIDGLLAATAMEHNLTLVTRNTKDVETTGVTVFNPWDPS